MNKVRGMTLDAAQRKFVQHLDKSAATSSKLLLYDAARDWIIQKIEAVVTEVVADAQFPINLGTLAAPTSLVSGDVQLVTTAALGTVVEIGATLMPYRVAAGTKLAVGHTQASGTGEAEIIMEAIPEDSNPTTPAERP